MERRRKAILRLKRLRRRRIIAKRRISQIKKFQKLKRNLDNVTVVPSVVTPQEGAG